MTLESGQESFIPLSPRARCPRRATVLDHVITFGTPLPLVDWDTGEHEEKRERCSGSRPVRRCSMPACSPRWATLPPASSTCCLFAAIVFALIELLALWIGTRLTRTVTGAVAQLYDATTHINRGDFSHRISVKSSDQLATLANSFNSMTASIENLIEEQKGKAAAAERIDHRPGSAGAAVPAAHFAAGFTGGVTASAVRRAP